MAARQSLALRMLMRQAEAPRVSKKKAMPVPLAAAPAITIMAPSAAAAPEAADTPDPKPQCDTSTTPRTGEQRVESGSALEATPAPPEAQAGESRSEVTAPARAASAAASSTSSRRAMPRRHALLPEPARAKQTRSASSLLSADDLEKRELERKFRDARKASLDFGRPPSVTTTSATGRFHPASTRRVEMLRADPLSNINYFAAHGAPDNDGRLKEGRDYVAAIAWNESLRAYEDDSVQGMPRYSGCASSSARKKDSKYHIEASVRNRMGIGAPQTQWRQSQLQSCWAQELESARNRRLPPQQRLPSPHAVARSDDPRTELHELRKHLRLQSRVWGVKAARDTSSASACACESGARSPGPPTRAGAASDNPRNAFRTPSLNTAAIDVQRHTGTTSAGSHSQRKASSSRGAQSSRGSRAAGATTRRAANPRRASPNNPFGRSPLDLGETLNELLKRPPLQQSPIGSRSPTKRQFIDEWELTPSPAPSAAKSSHPSCMRFGSSTSALSTPQFANRWVVNVSVVTAEEAAAGTISAALRGWLARLEAARRRAALAQPSAEAVSAAHASTRSVAKQAQPRWVPTSTIRMTKPLPALATDEQNSKSSETEPISFESFLSMKAMYIDMLNVARRGQTRASSRTTRASR